MVVLGSDSASFIFILGSSEAPLGKSTQMIFTFGFMISNLGTKRISKRQMKCPNPEKKMGRLRDNFLRTMLLFRARDHADPLHAGLLRHRHHLYHFAVTELLISLDQKIFVLFALIDRHQFCGEFVHCNGRSGVAQKNVALVVYRQNQILGRSLDLLRGGFGELYRQTLLQQGGGDHENNQKHQHHIDKRSDVDLCHRAVMRSVGWGYVHVRAPEPSCSTRSTRSSVKSPSTLVKRRVL